MPPPHPKEITSPKNPLVQRFKDAANGDLQGALLAEGLRLVQEGLDAGLPVLLAAVSPRLRDLQLADRLAAGARELVHCTDEVLAKMSALETHQGVAAVFEQPKWREQDLLRGSWSPLVAVAAGVRDPGNLGALVRTAEAAGASGFVTMAGGADPFRDKAVRGSMGSVFRLPLLHGFDAAALIGLAGRQRLQLVVADGSGPTEHTECDFRRPTLLVVGAEAAGVPAELAKAANVRVRIELSKPVESLNVAVAAGILLFEARRQRR
jgi:TrmH family RNA methyltransferase